MPRLADLLAHKLAAARRWGQPQSLKLAHGLHVQVSADPDQLILTREGGEPSEAEGHTCAKQLGWGSYEVAWLPAEGTERSLAIEKGAGLL